MPIHVEIRIRGDLDEVWRRTQEPELHARWDLRFSSITYLPRTGADEVQRFRYGTRIGLGIELVGWGETAGERVDAGTRTSALRFGSDDRRALIRSGSGYWKYAQEGDGVRFVTGYDYEPRWGAFGRVVDRAAFRPLIGWATAWSFDRLRLWIERGVQPEQAARQALVHALATVAVAFVWIWHGLVPKLLGPNPDELALLAEGGVPDPWAVPLTLAAGGAELALGLAFPFVARRRWPWLLTIALMLLALAGVLATAPERALTSFNPVTLNIPVALLAAIGLLSLRDLPSARRCRRRPQREPDERP